MNTCTYNRPLCHKAVCIPSTVRLTVVELAPTELLAVQVSSALSEATTSLITRVPPATCTLESPRVVTSTPSSLDQVTRGSGFPDEVQVNVAVEPTCKFRVCGSAATAG